MMDGVSASFQTPQISSAAIVAAEPSPTTTTAAARRGRYVVPMASGRDDYYSTAATTPTDRQTDFADSQHSNAGGVGNEDSGAGDVCYGQTKRKRDADTGHRTAKKSKLSPKDELLKAIGRYERNLIRSQKTPDFLQLHGDLQRQIDAMTSEHDNYTQQLAKLNLKIQKLKTSYDDNVVFVESIRKRLVELRDEQQNLTNDHPEIFGCRQLAQYLQNVVELDDQRKLWFVPHDVCAVCLQRNADPVRNEDCAHVLCGNCMKSIMMNNPNSSCPICRGPIRAVQKYDIFTATASRVEFKNAVVPQAQSAEQMEMDNAFSVVAHFEDDYDETVEDLDELDALSNPRTPSIYGFGEVLFNVHHEYSRTTPRLTACETVVVVIFCKLNIALCKLMSIFRIRLTNNYGDAYENVKTDMLTMADLISNSVFDEFSFPCTHSIPNVNVIANKFTDRYFKTIGSRIYLDFCHTLYAIGDRWSQPPTFVKQNITMPVSFWLRRVLDQENWIDKFVLDNSLSRNDYLQIYNDEIGYSQSRSTPLQFL